MPDSPRIFISYRRGDSSGHSGRLYDSLTSRIEGAEVFMDVDTIQPGADFDVVVREAVGACDVLLAVIGPRWLDASDAEGNRRLDKPDDLVRLEIETALERGVRLIPVLIDGTQPPLPDQLPPTLAPLAGRQAIFLDNVHWSSGVDELIAVVERIPQSRDGEREGEGELQPARKRVSVVHLELEIPGSDEGLDPELELGILTRVREELTTVAEVYGGSIAAEDRSLRMLFGATVLHEDDPLRAARAALDSLRLCAELGTRPGPHRLPPVAVRIGIDSGELLIGAASAPTGTAIRAAENLAEAAEAGQILLSPGVRSLLGEAVEAGEASGEAPASRLRAIAPQAVAIPRQFDSPSVGRRTESEMLVWAFERAVSERAPQLVTILGPAGIGKSRLVADSLEQLGSRGLVLTGHCLPYGRDITFWAVAEIVKQAAAIEEGDTREQAIGRIAKVLAGHESAALVTRQVATVLGLEEAAGSPEETFWAIRKLLEAVAGERPLSIVFEDLHWAEPMLLDLVDDLAERFRGSPLLLLCVARAELLERRPDWGGGKLNSTTISLDALSETDTDELIGNLLGETQLPAGFRERLTAAAEGNPLFVEQMLAMLGEERLIATAEAAGDADLAGVSIPPSIQALLSARVDGLPEQERETTRRASIVGRVFYRGALESLAGPQVRGAVGSELSALTRKQLIEPQGSTFETEDTYGFVHVLLRDAAYDSLPKRARAILHDSFATWLERRSGERAAEYEEIVGHHLEAAYRYRAELGHLSEAEKERGLHGGRTLASAGRRALSVGDVGAGTGFLERAMALLEAGSREHIEAGFDLFDAQLEGGMLADARTTLAGVTASLDGHDDETLKARLLIMRTFLGAHSGELAAGEELIGQVDEALAAFVGAGDDEGATRAHGLLADIRMDSGQFGAAALDLEQAIVHARRAGSRREEARMLGWLASALFWGPTPLAEAIPRCEEILEQAAGSPAGEAKTKLILAGLRGMAGDFGEARELFAEAAEAHRELGLNVALATGRQISGMIELLAGDAEAAVRELRDGFEALRAMDQDGYATGAAVLLGRALLAGGHSGELEPLIAFLEEKVPEDDLIGRAHLDLLRARVPGKRSAASEAEPEDARRAVEILSETDDLRTRGDVLVDLAEVVAPSDEARSCLAEALALYERKGVAPAAASVRRRLGEI